MQDFSLDTFPIAQAFVETFRVSRRRRLILLILGPTGFGNSLMAGQSLETVGAVLGLAEAAGWVQRPCGGCWRDLFCVRSLFKVHC